MNFPVKKTGPVAQLVMRLIRIEEISGSTPLRSTKYLCYNRKLIVNVSH